MKNCPMAASFGCMAMSAPFCRKVQADLMEMYDGDWRKVIDHVKVRRLILSEKDRRGHRHISA